MSSHQVIQYLRPLTVKAMQLAPLCSSMLACANDERSTLLKSSYALTPSMGAAGPQHEVGRRGSDGDV